MVKDRYVYHGGSVVNDLWTGQVLEIQDVVDRLNSCEHVFSRVVVVIEQREEHS